MHVPPIATATLPMPCWTALKPVQLGESQSAAQVVMLLLQGLARPVLAHRITVLLGAGVG